EMGEAVASFHHLNATASYQFVRAQRMHLCPGEHDRTFGDFAALGEQEVRDRLERGRLAGAVGPQQRNDLALGNLERDALEDEDDVVVDHLDIVDGQDRRRRRIRHDAARLRAFRGTRRRCRRLVHVAIGLSRHQLITRHPVVIFFSAAYLAAASLTIGAITESSELIQSDATFHFLPSQVWMRPTRVPSWSAQESLSGCSSPSKPSCLRRSAVRLRFSRPHLTCSPVNGFFPNFSWAVRIASTPSMALISPRTKRISPVSSHFAA